jgi:hypothetical protein
VDVQVRDALADAVVDRDEAALGAEGVLDRAGQPPDAAEERLHQLVRQVGQRLEVSAGHQQHVPREQRTVVEERDALPVVVDHVGRELSEHDPAEDAVGRRGWHLRSVQGGGARS